MSDSSQVSPYSLIGSEAGVERLVKTFYDLVGTEPEGAPLLGMHNMGHGLAHAREAQFAFLSALYVGFPRREKSRVTPFP